MQKDFDTWNIEKKKLDVFASQRTYKTREIWWCSLGVNIGAEQDGTGKNQDRPVLVLKGFSRQVCLVIPLTTSLKSNPYHIALGKIDGRSSFAITSQLRLVDTKRFIKKICIIEKLLFDEIRKAVKDML